MPNDKPENTGEQEKLEKAMLANLQKLAKSRWERFWYSADQAQRDFVAVFLTFSEREQEHINTQKKTMLDRLRKKTTLAGITMLDSPLDNYKKATLSSNVRAVVNAIEEYLDNRSSTRDKLESAWNKYVADRISEDPSSNAEKWYREAIAIEQYDLRASTAICSELVTQIDAYCAPPHSSSPIAQAKREVMLGIKDYLQGKKTWLELQELADSKKGLYDYKWFYSQVEETFEKVKALKGRLTIVKAELEESAVQESNAVQEIKRLQQELTKLPLAPKNLALFIDRQSLTGKSLDNNNPDKVYFSLSKDKKQLNYQFLSDGKTITGQIPLADLKGLTIPGQLTLHALRPYLQVITDKIEKTGVLPPPNADAKQVNNQLEQLLSGRNQSFKRPKDSSLPSELLDKIQKAARDLTAERTQSPRYTP